MCQEQPWGKSVVQFCFDTCRQIAPGRQESGPVDLEHIGRKALHADDGMGTLGTGQVLPDTSLKVPPRADRMAPKSLDFGGLGALSESAFAPALDPDLFEVTDGKGVGLGKSVELGV